MEKLVSVIVPVYKVEQFLDRCVKSIVDQTYKNLEIILVDDGSPDKCGKLCDKWKYRDSRIVVIHKQNEGVSSARNDGLYIAKGDFVCLVDSDDFLELNYVEKLVEKQKETNADLVFCRHYVVNEKNEKLSIVEKNFSGIIKEKKIEHFFFGGKQQVMGYIWRCLYNRTALKNVVFNREVKFCEDLLFLNEIILENNPKMALVEDCLYNYYENSSSITRVKSYENILEMLNGKDECCKLLDDYVKNDLAKALRYAIFIEELEFIRYGKNKNVKELKYYNYNIKENFLCFKEFNNLSIFQKLKFSLILKKRWKLLGFLLKLKSTI